MNISRNVVAVAVSNDKRPNNKQQIIKMGFRPKRSASGPKTNAPIIIPNKLLEISGPIALREIWRLAANAGAIKPIDCASKPSPNTMAEQIAAVSS